MPSAGFVLEHLIAAQARLDNEAAITAAKLPTTKATTTTTVAKEKKLLSVLKKFVQ